MTALSNLPGVKHISLNRKFKASFDQITDGTVHSDYATFNRAGNHRAGTASPKITGFPETAIVTPVWLDALPT